MRRNFEELTDCEELKRVFVLAYLSGNFLKLAPATSLSFAFHICVLCSMFHFLVHSCPCFV
jgi:hypothetical protein